MINAGPPPAIASERSQYFTLLRQRTGTTVSPGAACRTGSAPGRHGPARAAVVLGAARAHRIARRAGPVKA
jgi:hypothetical protein